MMLTIRKLFVTISPLRHRMLYSNQSIRKPRVTAKSKKWNQPQSTKVSQNFGPNPGVDEQLRELDLTEQELRDPNILEDLEQQFWNVDKVDGTIEREKYINQELQSIYQVSRKQFKEEKLPNMLLWEEKQQIKTLHEQDPGKWTLMQLAFSFPATPLVIKKILKAKWKFTSPEQIERHDSRVLRNWELLSKGELDVPNEDLKAHLLTFSQRMKILSSNRKDIATRTATPSGDSDRLEKVLKGGGVFGNIIKSYKRIEQSETVEENSTQKQVQSSAEAGLQKLYQPPQNDTFIIPRSVQNVRLRTDEPLTLENMKNRVLRDVSKGKTLAGDELNFIQDKLMKEREKNTYSLLTDPIGKEVKEEFQREEMGTDTNSASTNDQMAPSVNSIDITDTVEVIRSSDNKTEIDSKFIDTSQIKNIEQLEDKEILASLRTAKLVRSKMDDDIVVKAVKEYVSQSTESYPLEISIPKDKWKKGALYRVKDRFYTDDGEFLFRVPGMSMK